MIKEYLKEIREELIEEHLLSLVTCLLITLLVFVLGYCIVNNSRKVMACEAYHRMTGEKVIYIKGGCYKYVGNETFEKVVFKGVE